ncbi:hypothetical protein HanIR_Chr14g0671251 [Helianthus annuus]|nr:hypothetical protein HanIR_Chr14g0671251 [Helianthus annuus]
MWKSANCLSSSSSHNGLLVSWVWVFISLFAIARCCWSFFILFLPSCAPLLNHPLFFKGE